MTTTTMCISSFGGLKFVLNVLDPSRIKKKTVPFSMLKKVYAHKNVVQYVPKCCTPFSTFQNRFVGQLSV